MNKLCTICGYHFLANNPVAVMCYACFLEKHRAAPCAHSHSCFVNKDGNTECPCGQVILDEMGG